MPDKLTTLEKLVLATLLVFLMVLLFKAGMGGLYWDWFNGH